MYSGINYNTLNISCCCSRYFYGPSLTWHWAGGGAAAVNPFLEELFAYIYSMHYLPCHQHHHHAGRSSGCCCATSSSNLKDYNLSHWVNIPFHATCMPCIALLHCSVTTSFYCTDESQELASLVWILGIRMCNAPIKHLPSSWIWEHTTRSKHTTILAGWKLDK